MVLNQCALHATFGVLRWCGLCRDCSSSNETKSQNRLFCVAGHTVLMLMDKMRSKAVRRKTNVWPSSTA